MNDNAILDLLSQISQKLDIVVASQRHNVKKIIKDSYLTTESRIKMYEFFDGEHSLQDIAKKANVSVEAVRLFKVVLDNDGLIKIVRDGKKEFPSKIV